MEIYVPALSALVGVLVGAIISIYVARLQFRANVISKFRQDWIHELRGNIAEHQSIVARIELAKSSPAGAETYKDVNDLVQRLVLSGNKITLMLDLRDSKQSEVNSLLVQLRSTLEKAKGEVQAATVSALANQIADASRDIFDSEYGKAIKGK